MNGTTMIKQVVLEPGEVVWANLVNGCEDPSARGKMRPMVLVARAGPSWRAMGLTTSSTFRSGEARTPIPDWAAIGLRGPGYLWGDRLSSVCVLDIGDHIGWVDAGMLQAIIDETGIHGSWAEQLRASLNKERDE